MSNSARPRVVYPNEATDNDMNRQRYFGLTPTLLNLAFFVLVAALGVGGVLAAGGPSQVLDEAKQAVGLDKPQAEVVGGQRETGESGASVVPTPEAQCELDGFVYTYDTPDGYGECLPKERVENPRAYFFYLATHPTTLTGISSQCRDDGVNDIDGVPIFTCYDEAAGCDGYIQAVPAGRTYYRTEICTDSCPSYYSTYAVTNRAGVLVTACYKEMD